MQRSLDTVDHALQPPASTPARTGLDHRMDRQDPARTVVRVLYSIDSNETAHRHPNTFGQVPVTVLLTESTAPVLLHGIDPKLIACSWYRKAKIL